MTERVTSVAIADRTILTAMSVVLGFISNRVMAAAHASAPSASYRDIKKFR